MLVARSISELVERWQTGNFPSFSSTIIQDDIRALLVQCLCRILEGQSPSGAWGAIGPREETAYAVLALISLASLSWDSQAQRAIAHAIQLGRDSLRSTSNHAPEFLWIEKVTYGSAFLAESYVLAALHAPVDHIRTPTAHSRALELRLPADYTLPAVTAVGSLPQVIASVRARFLTPVDEQAAAEETALVHSHISASLVFLSLLGFILATPRFLLKNFGAKG